MAKPSKNTRNNGRPQATSGKTRKTPSKEKARLPAKEAMARRKVVTFGKAYVREVIAGNQRDFEKQVVHAAALGLGTPAQLRKMEPSELREKLAEKIKSTPHAQLPAKAEYHG